MFLGPPYKQNDNFTLEGKNGVWSSFLKEFLENIQNKDFGFKFFEKSQILRPFSSLAPSKLK